MNGCHLRYEEISLILETIFGQLRREDEESLKENQTPNQSNIKV
jgi:hypothetical protein